MTSKKKKNSSDSKPSRHPMIGALKGSFTFETGEPEPRRHPLFGALKGTFTIDADWDLTQPAMPEWVDLIDEKYGPELPKPKR